MSEQELIQSLNAIVGPGHVHSGDRALEYTVSGAAPKAAVFPGSPEEAARVVSLASERGLAVIPLGGRTQADFGERPRAYDIALVLTRLDRVVSYEPDDMTVTVEAGMTLERLQEVLAGGNQFLPVDPPLPKGATVGGAVATRAFGPLRLGFRTIADRLLGIKVITARGEIVKAGGRVVKNVAGYEMGRLYAGSFGTLAVITEVTFKTQPGFEARKILAVAANDLGAAERLVRAIIDSDALPLMFEITGPCPGGAGHLERLAQGALKAADFGSGDGALLVLGYGGARETVDWQVEEARRIVRRECRAHAATMSAATASALTASAPTASTRTVGAGGEAPEGSGAPEQAAPFEREAPWDPVHETLLDLHGRTREDEVILRMHVPDAVLIRRLAEALRLARSPGIGVRFAAHAGSGVARIAFSPALSGASESAAADLARKLRSLAEADGGHLLLERAPQGLKEAVGVFGKPRGDFFLHRAVKERLDPKGTLSPGRFIGGI